MDKKAKISNHKVQSSDPIGIFDSGIGGLTVTNAILQVLPKESIVYFGDTAHLPYGEKSAAEIQSYSLKICDVLLEQHCKVILIACHSASSAAYETVKKHVGNAAEVINMIDPVIEHIRQEHASKKIGLIGTRQTVGSNVYQDKIKALTIPGSLHALATPLLAPIIESQFTEKEAIQAVISDYLNHPTLADIDALILGCTHYPLVKEQILKHYSSKSGASSSEISIIDSAEVVASYLKQWLNKNSLANKGKKAITRFYISSYTDSFVANTKTLFKEALELENYPLWD
ncbi:MAG: glutamate racemase [Proteobacteria bacterium]|nr:glutamate racemase [Pseudomonadota bacterium]